MNNHESNAYRHSNRITMDNSGITCRYIYKATTRSSLYCQTPKLYFCSQELRFYINDPIQVTCVILFLSIRHAHISRFKLNSQHLFDPRLVEQYVGL
jgi:hypothetical protein